MINILIKLLARAYASKAAKLEKDAAKLTTVAAELSEEAREYAKRADEAVADSRSTRLEALHTADRAAGVRQKGEQVTRFFSVE